MGAGEWRSRRDANRSPANKFARVHATGLSRDVEFSPEGGHRPTAVGGLIDAISCAPTQELFIGFAVPEG
jgi:hypothetical protein